MPIPPPDKGQTEKDFISHCMSDEDMAKTFPNGKQRYAVCISQFEKAKKSKGSEEVEWKEVSKDKIVIY